MSKTRGFRLHERLAADSVAVGVLDLCQLRLMNNCLWPWLILIPQIDDVSEIHDLSPDAAATLSAETAAASLCLTRLFEVDKVNVGALGNIVPQLHMHVVGRRRDDPAWPGPVWGSGFAEPYDDARMMSALRRLREYFAMPAE